jgi:hypothetical protein
MRADIMMPSLGRLYFLVRQRRNADRHDFSRFAALAQGAVRLGTWDN